MTRCRSSILYRVLPLALLFATAPLATARGAGEFGWLKPGKDANFSWMDFHKVAEEAAKTKKPVLVYFFEGEKTIKNAGAMIDAQMRLFPDEKVRGASAGFLCTKVDLTDPEAVERAIAMEARKGDKAGRRDRRRGRRGRGGGEGAGEDSRPAPGEGEGDRGRAKEEAAPPQLILSTDKWAKSVSIYLLDYQGRPIQKITKLSSNSRNFIKTLGKARVANEKRIKADERAAEKAAKQREKEEAEEAERAAEEEAEKQDSENPDSENSGVDD